jgi:hypothetical protein
MRKNVLAALASVGVCGLLHGAPLASQGWTVTGPDGLPVAGLTDGNPATRVTLEPFELAADISVLIDLGAPHVLIQLLVNDGTTGLTLRGKKTAPPPDWPGKVMVFVGDEPYPKKRIAQALLRPVYGKEVRSSFSLRFPPVRGRYVRLQLGEKAHAYPWVIAEVELCGWRAADVPTPTDAVVLPTNAPAPLALAASELSHYLGMMLDRPIPVIAPDAAERYPGTLYRVEDLKPLAATVESMRANLESGRIPATPVHVERKGREVLFIGFPYRHTLWSVWAFLEAQGVRWLYPDPYGEFVPRREAVDLSRLPLTQTPAAASVYANFDVDQFLTADRWEAQQLTDGFLYWWRNRWTHTWGNAQSVALGGSEVPRNPSTFDALPEDYRERFEGWPHNFSTVLPERILREHPTWWGFSEEAGKRVPPGNGAPAFCTSNPEAITWIADKAVAVAGHDGDPAPRYWLLPMDATRYCACEDCRELNAPPRPETVAWVAPARFVASDAYYHLVNEVAKRVKAAAPRVTIAALAYAEVHAPPERIARFEDNVVVQVCIYGEQNLPMASPRNAAFRKRMEAWNAKCGRLEHYDYVLLQESHADVPRPLVGALADRARFLHGIGALDGGTQATLENLPRSPWNAYVYARLMWDVTRDEQAELRAFTDGFYQEASESMYRYITAMDRYHVTNDISLRVRGYASGVPQRAFPYALLRELYGYIEQARTAAAAAHWTVRTRVDEAAQGFHALLEAKGLRTNDLAEAADFPSVGPADEPLQIDLMQSRIHPPTRGDPLSVILYHDRRVGEWIRVREAGRYTVRFATNGFDKPPRPVTIWFGSRASDKLEIPDGAAQIEAAFEVPAGLHDVYVQGDWGCGAWGTARMTVSAAVAATDK